MTSTKDDIQRFRAILSGDLSGSSDQRETLKEAAVPAAKQPFKLSPYAATSIPRYFNLTAFCADHSSLMVEAKNIRRRATGLIAQRIAEGFDLSDYVKTDARGYYPHLSRNIQRSIIKENHWIKAGILTEGLPNHDTSWLLRATETMRSRCEAGEDCTEVINDLAREYAETEDGHHEAFEMARDALSKRSWELNLTKGPDADDTLPDFEIEDEAFVQDDPSLKRDFW